MSTNSQRIKRRTGLAETVRTIASKFPDVESVSIGGSIRGCCGDRKVKVPTRWKKEFPAKLEFSVFDGENGARDVRVTTKRPGPISRLIGKRLQEEGVRVC